MAAETFESTMIRRQLGHRLRRLRDAARKTREAVAEAGLSSSVKLWRIETGQLPVKPGDVRGLCWLYGVDTATTEMLTLWAHATRGSGYWEDFDEPMSVRDGLYLGLEATAQHLQIHSPDQVPVLLQTPEYSEACYLAVKPEATASAVGAYVKLQQERHTALTQRTPPIRLTAVLNEGALVRPVGGPAVLQEQLRLLPELANLVHVDIRYLPWQVGAHAAAGAAGFTVLDFADEADPAVVYVESLTGARYLEVPTELDQYRHVFARVYAQSRPISDFQSDGVCRGAASQPGS